MSRLSHLERHMVHRIGWLRAAVLGANDGLVSTASLVVGVAAAGSARPEILIAGLAGLAAGSMSMAAGEYVSVSSQTDAEQADIARETRELATMPEMELDELTNIYVSRGLDEDLARKVAIQLSEKDALGAHARDELGISETVAARPVQAAIVSAFTFAVGAVCRLACTGRTDHADGGCQRHCGADGSGRSRRLGRRRRHGQGGRPGHVLGGPGHGGHGRSRHDIRGHRGLAGGISDRPAWLTCRSGAGSRFHGHLPAIDRRAEPAGHGPPTRCAAQCAWPPGWLAGGFFGGAPGT